jgi:hypothetical protein
LSNPRLAGDDKQQFGDSDLTSTYRRQLATALY